MSILCKLDFYGYNTACLQLTLAQLFPEAWVGSMGQCSAYLSKMSMNFPLGASTAFKGQTMG